MRRRARAAQTMPATTQRTIAQAGKLTALGRDSEPPASSIVCMRSSSPEVRKAPPEEKIALRAFAEPAVGEMIFTLRE